MPHIVRMAGIQTMIEVNGFLDRDPTYSLGTRLARLRRAVGDGLRSLREGLDRFGDTLKQMESAGN